MIARLHSAIHVNGFGNLGPLIDKNTLKINSEFVMTKIEEGILITGKDPKTSKKFEVVIPHGNLQSIQLETST